MSTVKELSPLNVEAIRARRRKAHLAGKLAVQRGILGKTDPVLDVGCRNPYVGVYYSLRKDLLWNGPYWGIDETLPRRAVETWRQRSSESAAHKRSVTLIGRPFDLEDAFLPFPPTGENPRKYISTAFLIDTLGSARNPERILRECRRVAASVVVVGGVTGDQLERWDFQIIHSYPTEGETTHAGVFLDLRAEERRRLKDAFPEKAMGFFSLKDKRGQGMFPQVIGICQGCGKPDATGKSRFGCVYCGHDNTVRRKA